MEPLDLLLSWIVDPGTAVPWIRSIRWIHSRSSVSPRPHLSVYQGAVWSVVPTRSQRLPAGGQAELPQPSVAMAEEEAPPTEEPAARSPPLRPPLRCSKSKLPAARCECGADRAVGRASQLKKLYENPNRQLHSAAAADVAQEADQAIDVHPRILLCY